MGLFFHELTYNKYDLTFLCNLESLHLLAAGNKASLKHSCIGFAFQTRNLCPLIILSEAYLSCTGAVVVCRHSMCCSPGLCPTTRTSQSSFIVTFIGYTSNNDINEMLLCKSQYEKSIVLQKQANNDIMTSSHCEQHNQPSTEAFGFWPTFSRIS